jgi:hypothetical protein
MNQSPTRRGALDGASLSYLIVLALLTVVFAFLAYSRADAYRLRLEGDPENPNARHLTQLLGEIKEIEDDIDEKEKDIARKRKRMENQDYRLAELGAHWQDGRGWILGGEDTQGGWTVTRTAIAERAKRLQAWTTMHGGREAQTFDRLEDLIREFQDAQQEVIQRATEIDERLQRDRDNLLAELERFAEEKRVAEEQYRQDFSVRATRKTQLDQRIRELLELRLEWLEALETDGRIAQVDLDGRYLIIDIGSKDGLRPGTRFEVFQHEKGTYTVKGLVEAADVGGHVATCRILEQTDARRNPIVAGDLIGNPVFDSDDQKIFVLAGEYSLYNKADLARFIQASGGIVREELSPGVDFLVAGARSEGEQDAAREYRVKAMFEKQLVRFLDTTFVPGQ